MTNLKKIDLLKKIKLMILDTTNMTDSEKVDSILIMDEQIDALSAPIQSAEDDVEVYEGFSKSFNDDEDICPTSGFAEDDFEDDNCEYCEAA